jgi:hypothetical protein
MWGKQQHWWCVDEDGNIIDPTVNQFPTKGAGAEYEEFNGNVKCSECGKDGHEDEFEKDGRYVFCSSQCYGKFVGLI